MWEAERQEFFEWMRIRQAHFDDIGATPREIADLAIIAGINRIVAREWEHRERFQNIEKRS